MSVSAYVASKAERYLVAARVRVTCEESRITATVTGDMGRWILYREPDRWRCTCPARKRCSHVEAVERIT